MSLREIELQQAVDRRDKYIAKQEIEIDKLTESLRMTANELESFISLNNSQIKSRITSTDMDEPEYYDYQTVHEAMKLVAK